MKNMTDVNEKEQVLKRVYSQLHLALVEHQKGLISFDEMMSRWMVEKEIILQFLEKQRSSLRLSS